MVGRNRGWCVCVWGGGGGGVRKDLTSEMVSPSDKSTGLY